MVRGNAEIDGKGENDAENGISAIFWVIGLRKICERAKNSENFCHLR
jgi:hypothetical protein